MPWRGIGVAIAVVVVSLIALGRASSIVVDWAWFSSVGYLDVFWTAFATKAVLFAAVFAISALLIWVNGRLALRLARPQQLRLPAAFGPWLRIASSDSRRRCCCHGVCSFSPPHSSSHCWSHWRRSANGT